MKGKELIIEKVKEIIGNKSKDYNINEVENGLEIKINNYPYTFKVLCYEQIGWNVYLEIKGDDDLIEHPETDIIYSEMENLIDEVNYIHYGLDENIKPIVDKNFEELDNALAEFSEIIENVEINSLAYTIHFYMTEGQSPVIKVKYSIAKNNWSVEADNIFKDDNIHDNIFELFNTVNRLTQKFNKKIGAINYYF